MHWECGEVSGYILKTLDVNRVLYWQGTQCTFSFIILFSQCPWKVRGMLPIWQMERLYQSNRLKLHSSSQQAFQWLSVLLTRSQGGSSCVCSPLVPFAAWEQHSRLPPPAPKFWFSFLLVLQAKPPEICFPYALKYFMLIVMEVRFQVILPVVYWPS